MSDEPWVCRQTSMLTNKCLQVAPSQLRTNEKWWRTERECLPTCGRPLSPLAEELILQALGPREAAKLRAVSRAMTTFGGEKSAWTSALETMLEFPTLNHEGLVYNAILKGKLTPVGLRDMVEVLKLWAVPLLATQNEAKLFTVDRLLQRFASRPDVTLDQLWKIQQAVGTMSPSVLLTWLKTHPPESTTVPALSLERGAAASSSRLPPVIHPHFSDLVKGATATQLGRQLNAPRLEELKILADMTPFRADIVGLVAQRILHRFAEGLSPETLWTLLTTFPELLAMENVVRQVIYILVAAGQWDRIRQLDTNKYWKLAQMLDRVELQELDLATQDNEHETLSTMLETWNVPIALETDGVLIRGPRLLIERVAAEVGARSTQLSFSGRTPLWRLHSGSDWKVGTASQVAQDEALNTALPNIVGARDHPDYRVLPVDRRVRNLWEVVASVPVRVTYEIYAPNEVLEQKTAARWIPSASTHEEVMNDASELVGDHPVAFSIIDAGEEWRMRNDDTPLLRYVANAHDMDQLIKVSLLD